MTPDLTGRYSTFAALHGQECRTACEDVVGHEEGFLQGDVPIPRIVECRHRLCFGESDVVQVVVRGDEPGSF